MTSHTKITFLLCCLLIHHTGTMAQNAVAISSDKGRDLHIALNWNPANGAVKYNVFRRNETDTKYPALPLNKTSIQMLTNCTAIKALLITSPDSTDWKLVAEGLSEKNVLFDPCKLGTISSSSNPIRYERLQALAKGSMPIAIAAGWGYKDNTVTADLVYYYKIVALDKSNRIVATVANDLKVTAGIFDPLPAPSDVRTEEGDDAVLVTWNKEQGTAGYPTGYLVERAPTITGLFQQVNESRYPVDIMNHLNGDTIIPALKGILDYQRYCVNTGKDSSHLVNGAVINGPVNGTSYYYRVRAIDLFDRPGNISGTVGPVTPKDITPPSVPIDITTTVDDVHGAVTIRWGQVVKNISGHWERPDSSVRYMLYRFTSTENPDLIPSDQKVDLGEINTIKGLWSRDTTDLDINLRSTYGNKKWWYRIRSIDIANNISQWSTAVSAIVKDTTAPRITKNIMTKGYEDYISVKWDPNTDPDIASYVIYRSLCHLGSWVECLSPDKDTCYKWLSYNPLKKPGEKDVKMPLSYHVAENKSRLPCPCSGPFVFLGEVTSKFVTGVIKSGLSFFDDRTIPDKSPLCYAYWIKSKDSSDNISGSYPIPSIAERNEIRCERLHDRTPPEPAIISGLMAQAEQIRVEWIGPPTQDTRAYHVYRAEGKKPADEPAVSDYKWVGGMTIELPPVLPVIMDHPYTPPGMAPCDKISVQATPWMSQGIFEDKSVHPKLTYWYKVVGIDYDGNQTLLEKAAAISTFSFSRKIPDSPVMDVPVMQTDPCGVSLTWSPSFDPAKHRGFIVYRSNSAGGPFIPVVVSPLNKNSFTDYNVLKGQTYWYSVAILMLNGRLSAVTPTQSITP